MEPKTIVAYAAPLSVAPGETLRVMASCEPSNGASRPPASTFRANLVRLICGDDRNRGAGYREILVPASLSGAYPTRTQRLRPGS